MFGILTGGVYDNTGIVCNHSIVVTIPFYGLKGLSIKVFRGVLKSSIQNREVS
jgi:hypothetical protein